MHVLHCVCLPPQVVAGFRFKLRFDMRRTTCAKAEHKDLHDLCVPDEENVVRVKAKQASPCDLFQAVFGLMHVCLCAGVCQLQLYSGCGAMET